MLLRPTRPLPRKFRRTASKSSSKFVRERHKKHREYYRRKWTRSARRAQQSVAQSLRFVRRYWWIAVTGCVVLACAVALFSPAVRVQEIRIRRTDARLDSARIQRSLKPIFGRHMLFLSAGDVRPLIEDAEPDVQDIALSKQYPSQIVLTVTLHPLVAQLVVVSEDTGTGSTDGQPALKQAAVNEYLTDNGYYIALPFKDASKTLPVIRIVDWAVRPQSSTRLFSPEFLKRMQDTEEALRNQFGIAVKERTVFQRAREYHLKGKKLTLWFDERTPMQEQLNRYRLFLGSGHAGEASEYIDLRLADRIVYK